MSLMNYLIHNLKHTFFLTVLGKSHLITSSLKVFVPSRLFFFFFVEQVFFRKIIMTLRYICVFDAPVSLWTVNIALLENKDWYFL